MSKTNFIKRNTTEFPAENISESRDFIYNPMQMHLHTCHQQGGSMEGHIYNAASLGMRYLRFTDHDVRTGRKRYPVDGFDFSSGETLIYESDKRYYGWEPFITEDSVEENAEEEFSLSPGDGYLEMSLKSHSTDWTENGIAFVSTGTRHTVSLIAEVSLELDFELDTSSEQDTQLWLVIVMSQRPPENIPARLIYSVLSSGYNTDPHTAEIPLSARIEAGNRYYATLPISKDVIGKGIGDLDNVFGTIRVVAAAKNGGEIKVRLTRFKINVLSGFNDVIVKQRKIADEIGANYQVKPFVTTEISSAGHHKNCYTSDVPVINYEMADYRVTQTQAIDHVKAYGGIFSYNHPFSSYKNKRPESEREAERFIANRAAELASSKVYGASLIEVGFTEGRGGFSLDDHLRLWDLLSLAGVFITGGGDSDSHSNDVGWYDGNNFACWIAAPRELPFPVPERDFNNSIIAGRVYSGDPVKLRGGVSFTSSCGVQMGGIILSSAGDSVVLHFECGHTEQGWEFRVIINGGEYIREKLAGGSFKHEFKLASTLTVSFARIELYDENGRCLMFTNPIYLIRQDEYDGVLPKERIYKC